MKTLFAFFLLWTVSLAAVTDELPTPTDAETLTYLKAKLGTRKDAVERSVRRLADLTLEVDSALVFPGDFSTFKKVAPDFSHWRDWTLHDINLPPPADGEYLLQIHDIVEKEPGTVSAIFSFNLPLMRNHRARSLQMKVSQNPGAFLIEGETIPAEKSAVKRAKAFLKAFPAKDLPGHVWVQFKALVVFKNWFLFQALPDKVVLRELGDRLGYIAQNYQREEQRLKSGDPAATRAVSTAVPGDND